MDAVDFGMQFETKTVHADLRGGPMDGIDASGLRPKSELALRAVAMPVFANAHGDIFGGWLLSQMDLAGGVGHPLPVAFFQ